MGLRIVAVLLVLAVAVICALLAFSWCLVRGKGVDQAVKAGAAVFVGMATLGIAIIAFLQPG
ncbi:hypothetical protein [Microbispora sp. NBRC 16548]|uniref:hypothetical protein n=1 Tax=Microbispora sp. NBRC 16548 TaxID=3030994 RepID=UPI0024A14644|nr:hypothetical protein [Microbispora sp. NBRC 16548]GLX05695.1 hypothetical protein Misp03_26220 [Microbispora sp. NBRC 16548]